MKSELGSRANPTFVLAIFHSKEKEKHLNPLKPNPNFISLLLQSLN
jgi:hypothetical protein